MEISMTSVSGGGTNPRTVLLTRIVKFMLGPSDSVAHLEVVICRTQVLTPLIWVLLPHKKTIFHLTVVHVLRMTTILSNSMTNKKSCLGNCAWGSKLV